ncbi:MAG: nitroreductase/quinone reductase family protein [Acidimicrobiales bacterium]
MYSRLVNRFSATRAGSFVVKHVASKVDPVLFRWSKGRITSTGKPTLPMLALTTTGARSGQPRVVQLAYHADGDDLLVVASAMGQARHPAWRYNLDAHPNVRVLVRGDEYAATATPLGWEERARLWDAIATTIPQMRVYEQRTDREIQVYRLRRRSDTAGDRISP